MPKSMRSTAEVKLTECRMQARYATAFPRALPPVRKIGLGRRALGGVVLADTLPHDQIDKFASPLVQDFLALLEFNPDVQRWDPHPVRLRVGETGSFHTPDVLVSFYPKGKSASQGPYCTWSSTGGAPQ